MDKRAQILLKTLVEHYISDGQPIGSRTLLQHSGLDVSAATIRNVMSDLEHLGFIASPHTSAGRIPTQKGYRLFVDSLLTVQPLETQALQQLKNGLSSPNPTELIASAADMLSQLTQFAGLVMIPKRKRAAFKHLEFLPLSETRILVIIVTSDGNVQNRILLTEKIYSQSELTQASNYFNANFSGQTFEEVQQKLHIELQQMQSDMNHLMSAALEASSKAVDNNNHGVVIAGERNLLQVDELSTNVSSLRKLFEIFERRTSLMQLLDNSQHAEGIQIFIGGESGYLPLDECSMITAPYEADGQVVGTLGVIGPTRMAYERVIPIVDVTAKLLSNALSNN
ncbi:MAG: heat-inducible transcriptional repressor HrcA [Methylotenera sp.]|uniref:heat-inducible transcriptional repressor HrcA n=1 Tax=Methylotenera sp. TaxID=2051956 RepID=UPI0027173FE5|nr:heat-inducible transcriptional repressor HrcA [Methylotenera sp.]MDO9205231.1 heat-inducible transcriptional repressor HrcA [Methylotenera sp.]MDO9392891.1 heat-inducible transcriptional repressor HrcA [Methylotenera sp.]MDP1522170.1 heat-inducible transcriptional repressor HrcA [Methylotenera sp.]MDP2230917.1 heat-inducible transcriptional repressor HrcA [Methylotenera sp.]MDP3140867.1 heat-inducible transcriptional repressor HrcA [Methylotenera sp.]